MPETSRTIDRFREAFPVFGKAGPFLVSEIVSQSILQPFSQGVVLYHEGDACSRIAFLLSGGVRVFKIGETGREITLYEIGAGETCILNASCILSDRGYPAHAVTTAPGEMLLLPAGVFRRLIAGHPEVRDFVFALLSDRLALVMALVEEVAFGRMDERLANYLSSRATAGQMNATHQAIANDLGTSREVVSRLLKEFEREGSIRLERNRIHIVDGSRVSSRFLSS